MESFETNDEPTCKECGFCYVTGLPEDEERHVQFHDEKEEGPPLRMKDGIHLVSLDSPIALQFALERALSIGNREAQYDFPLFTVNEESRSDPVGAIQVANGRAISVVLTRCRQCDRQSVLESFERTLDGRWRPQLHAPIDAHERRSIEFIWVHRKHRGRRILDASLARLVSHFKIAIAEFSHCVPFTEAAIGFWRKRSLRTVYLSRMDDMPAHWPFDGHTYEGISQLFLDQ
jgi:hypothetical protein